MTTPTLRKPFGVLAMLLWIAVWSVIALVGAEFVLDRHWLFQLVYFALIGTIWIAPLKPLLRWMETGRWRA